MNDLFQPAPQLRPFVEGYWQRSGHYAPEKKVRVVADACTKIIFELVPMPWPSEYLLGTQLYPIVVTLSGTTDRVGIRFRPGMASFFLGRPLNGFTGGIVGLNDLGVEEGPEIRDRLTKAGASEARVVVLDEWLLSRWETLQPDARDVEETMRLSKGVLRGLSPPELAAMMGWSDRRLQRVCRERFGASAANLHRFFRFESLQTRLSGPPAELAGLAAELGFSDQSHMAREFRTFAGSTISAFLRERAAVGNLQDAGSWLPVLRRAEESGAWSES